ncbi:MAG: hypothetical protein AAFR24_12615 [Cyanobacteria bacterium J06627_3]
MKTLLRVDASTHGSNTRVLTDYFQTKWLSHNPESKVIHHCLVSNPIPHITFALEGMILDQQTKEKAIILR